MDTSQPRRSAGRFARCLVLAGATMLLPPPAGAAQALTGALLGTVRDEQGGILIGARAELRSPALIGGPETTTTNARGQLRFPALPPGIYSLDIEATGFAAYHEADIRISLGATIERNLVLTLSHLAQSIVVEPGLSRLDDRDPGFATRFGPEDLSSIPTRRVSMFDFIRAAPGLSATSPSSATVTTVSAFGSGVNENAFLIDGTNFTCPCNGIARAEPGVDFIQEIQVQSAGASAEFGNAQGAVLNVVTKRGAAYFLSDASYYGQPAGLTGQPVTLALSGGAARETGYERSRYRDLTATVGGPAVPRRLWFFAGYQYLRDFDSQPGTDPAFPRKYEQNKVFGKLTWQLAPGWQLDQSLHDEHWVNPEQPTLGKPFEATLRNHASVPAVTFGHLTHASSRNTLWDVRAGRFAYNLENEPGTGDLTTPSRTDTGTGITTGAPPQFGALYIARTTAKATVSHYWPALLGTDQDWKAGVQIERGEHRSPSVIPTGTRFVDSNGVPAQAIVSAPSVTGGLFITSAAFVSAAITTGNRVTVNAGLRFEHTRAISQDLHGVGLDGRDVADVVQGLGTLYVWNDLSPRLGLTAKLTADGRTLLRGSYGRFRQGVLTGEIGGFHPGATAVTTTTYDRAAGVYANPSTVDPAANLRLDRHMRAPRTDEYSAGLDRDLGHQVAVAVAYIRKAGSDFIGWTDTGGQYRAETRPLDDGRSLPVFVLVNAPKDRRFLLTNQDAYSLAYHGLVTVIERRRARGWQAFGSYTYSRASGLQPASGTTAAGGQVSTVAPPPGPAGLTFGRDPNDLTFASGRLPNDRPHMARLMGRVQIPNTGVAVAANFAFYSGKPWAASVQIPLAQNSQQRILIEPRGSRRLSSQSLLDLRVSKALPLAGRGRIDLLLDVLNLLNDTAEEGIVTDNLRSVNFAVPSVFVDPRRAMIGARVHLGR